MTYILTKKAKWYRVAVFGVLFMVMPTILQGAWTAYRTYHYQTADISSFYEGIELQSDNICYGDTTQPISSVRYVHGTATGWKVDIVRELFRVEKNVSAKVYEESATAFMEVLPDGKSYREAAIPVQPAGLYRWEINLVRIYLPYGVERVDLTPLIGNGFAIEDCEDADFTVEIIK